MAFWLGNEPAGELAALDVGQLCVRVVLEGAVQMGQPGAQVEEKVGTNVQYGFTEDTGPPS
eukprot:9773620-Lingulodinium_polyedra.AAC.1